MKDLDEVYNQRNHLAILAAKLALENGWDAGWQQDDDNDWDREWQTVVYIDTPEGQISFHMDPKTRHVAEEQLPKYEGEWDGTWFKTHRYRIQNV